MKRANERLAAVLAFFAIVMVAAFWSAADAATIQVSGLLPGSTYTCTTNNDATGDLVMDCSPDTPQAGGSCTIVGKVTPPGALVFLYKQGTSLIGSGKADYVVSNPVTGTYTFNGLLSGAYSVIPVLQGIPLVVEGGNSPNVTLDTNCDPGGSPSGAQLGSGQSTFTVDFVPQAGPQCGSAYLQSFDSNALNSSSAGLCSCGASCVSAFVTTASGWSWSCVAAGQTANCFASLARKDGVCGSSSGKTFTTAPSANLCDASSPSVTTNAGSYTWDCAGSNGGSTGHCSATRAFTVTPSAGSGGSISPNVATTVPYNQTQQFTVTPSNGLTATISSGSGACGGSPASGASQFTYTTNPISSNCNVQVTFSNVTITGACGSSNGQTLSAAPTTNLCSAGTPSTVTGSGPWSWTCQGSAGTLAANCSANKQGGVNGEVPITGDIPYNGLEYVGTIKANTTQYFTTTIPAGATGLMLAVASVTQNGVYHTFLVDGAQTLTEAKAADYYSDFIAIYDQYGYGFPLVIPYPGIAGRIPSTGTPAWARMNGSWGGDSLNLTEGASVTVSTTNHLGGNKFYIVIKNISGKDISYKIALHG
jgi:hypothetical protein